MGFVSLVKKRNSVVFAPKDLYMGDVNKNDINELISLGYDKLEALELLDVLSSKKYEVDDTNHYEQESSH
jgi:hypothetical protein